MELRQGCPSATMESCYQFLPKNTHFTQSVLLTQVSALSKPYLWEEHLLLLLGCLLILVFSRPSEFVYSILVEI
jgi:hypothetical protein